MPLANYSTSIAAAKTAGEIQGMLAGAGAKAIITEYDDEAYISALAFQVPGPQGDLSIRLPVDAQATLKVMQKDGLPSRFCTMDHARRVAWRIIKDWLRAQLALLETEMVRMEEIFLPYVITQSGETVYQIMRRRNFELPEGRG